MHPFGPQSNPGVSPGLNRDIGATNRMNKAGMILFMAPQIWGVLPQPPAKGIISHGTLATVYVKYRPFKKEFSLGGASGFPTPLHGERLKFLPLWSGVLLVKTG